jgi:hypothetical protein
MHCATRRRSTDYIYRPFANILIPYGETEDALDSLKRLEQMLRPMLANMPERNKGEIESNMETLLGPPQLSAALCLLEIVVYLHSNNRLHRSHYNSNPVLQWVVETVPFHNMSRILRTKLPTIQEFQLALLRFGVENAHIDFVKDLLHLDTGLKETLHYSTEMIGKAIKTGNATLVRLLLDADSGCGRTAKADTRSYLGTKPRS